jgi:hypothetical protein
MREANGGQLSGLCSRRCQSRTLLLLAFLFLIAGCKGGGGNSGAANPTSNSPAASPWAFGFVSGSSGSSTNSLVVNANLILSSGQLQTTGILIGRACIRPRFSSESITGSVSGNSVSLTLSFGGVTILLTGTLSADGKSMSGTYTMNGACGNDTGAWTATKVSSVGGIYIGSYQGTNQNAGVNANITANLTSGSGGSVTGTFLISSVCFQGVLNVMGTQTGSQFGGTATDNLGDTIEFAFASTDFQFQSMTGIIQVDTGSCAGDVAGATLAGGGNNSSTGGGGIGRNLGWTWMNGSQSTNQLGTYGSQGTAAPANIPGARDAAVTWTDAAGNFWLFGGAGYDSAAGLFLLNDLWKYSSGQWTWAGGLNAGNSAGNYGTLGVAAAGNVPAGRSLATGWSDAAGNFWLFGGSCLLPFQAHCNDLWKYSAGEWAWMGGSDAPDQRGTYGTLGTAAPSNIPGGRQGAVSWTDAAGNFWLFGGEGIDSTSGAPGIAQLNDLWKYSTVWTWMGGSNIANQGGAYGTLGIADVGNVPGARSEAVSWTDAAENFWLFGGFGYDSVATEGLLNDLWKYSAGKWAWMGGSNIANQQGNYGTQGVAAASNVPGARNAAISWTDKSGNLWLFGGSVQAGAINDLWKYSAGQWTWVSGSEVAQFGNYGTQGVAAPGNGPGGRFSSLGWIDGNGNLWLFGGNGYAAQTPGFLSDLWMNEP